MAYYITAFFGALLAGAVVWLLGFRFLFTRKCIGEAFLELGVARKKVQRVFIELRRKSFHLGGLLIPFIYYFGLKEGVLTQRSASLMLGAVTAFLWLVEVLRFVSPPFRRLYNVVFGKMLRKSETAEGSTKLTGTGFFFFGCWLTVTLFDPLVAMASILYLVLGDLAAALVGIGFGRIKIGKKSLEGTLACFGVCYVLSLVLFWHAPFHEYICLVGAMTAALVELFNPSFVDDNLTIPVLSGAALHFAILRTAVVTSGAGNAAGDASSLGHIPEL